MQGEQQVTSGERLPPPPSSLHEVKIVAPGAKSMMAAATSPTADAGGGVGVDTTKAGDNPHPSSTSDPPIDPITTRSYEAAAPLPSTTHTEPSTTHTEPAPRPTLASSAAAPSAQTTTSSSSQPAETTTSSSQSSSGSSSSSSGGYHSASDRSVGVDASMAAQEHDDEEDDDDEELECRVCRGPAEPPHLPLYHPCKCSGSIGLIHQECLLEWLASPTRPAVGDKCELCSTPFKFEPRYAEDAPDVLPPWEVVLGVLRRGYRRWLPLLLRTLVAVVLWVGLLPLATGYLYHGWLHRPSAVVARLSWKLVPGDAVSGAIVCCVVIVSFLSMMSFADFLRFHWNEVQMRGDDDGQEEGARGDDGEEEDVEDRGGEDMEDGEDGRGGDLDGEEVLFAFDDDDDELFVHEHARRARGGRNRGDDAAAAAGPDFDPAVDLHDMEDGDGHDGAGAPRGGGGGGGGGGGRGVRLEDDDDVNMEIHLALDELLGLRGPLPGLVRNLLWFLAFNTTYLGLFAFIPHTVGRSVAGALGGSRLFKSVYIREVVLVKHLPWVKACGVQLGMWIDKLNEEAATRNVILRLPDVSSTILGYLTMALMIFLWQSITVFVLKHWKDMSTIFGPTGAAAAAADEAAAAEEEDAGEQRRQRRDQRQRLEHVRRVLADEIDMDEDGNLRLVEGHVAEEAGDDADPEHEEQEEDDADEPLDDGVNDDGTDDVNFTTALNCAAAVVKVGVLLFLKMLLLPLFLGIGLDLATLNLFDCTVESRVLYAGSDLFSAALLHWVAGITFMLLVTVSVLQLREVVHPDLFATVIRPQEPQPDLLGNLLQENSITHTKRMLVSLGIYVALLAVHVWLPAHLLVVSGVGAYLPFVRPHVWHLLMPQLQVPLELLVFHLSMLAFLEKYKNNIGRMQHHFLVRVCGWLSLTEHVLPRTVKGFDLIGMRRIYSGTGGSEDNTQDEDHLEEKSDNETLADASKDLSKKSTTGLNTPNGAVGSNVSPKSTVVRVDSFWRELASTEKPTHDLLVANLRSAQEVLEGEEGPIETYEDGTTRRNGQRVLSGSEVAIRLPADLRGDKPACLLKCSVGEYRLRVRKQSESATGDEKDSSNLETSASDGSENKGPDVVELVKIMSDEYDELENDAVDTKPGHVPAPSASTSRKSKKMTTTTVDEDSIVEVWREIAAQPIARPPEGWDDLDEGGAEAQGRWAWGNEKKSEIEEGVAYRTPFGHSPSVTLLGVKLFALLVLSWGAILVTICTIMSLPLVAGRSVLTLLHIPPRYMHDPDAFAIGVGVLVPIISKVVDLMSSTDGDKVQSGLDGIKKWLATFRLPQSQNKVRVVLASIGLWLFFVPLSLGLIYDLAIVKDAEWWAGKEESETTGAELAKTWGAGLIFIHMWAALCYYDVFGKRFWANLGGPEENAARNNGGGPGRPVEDFAIRGNDDQTHEPVTVSQCTRRWQGKDGRINRFARSVHAVLFEWEWDKVDRVVLLDECVRPVSENLLVSLFVPLLMFLAQYAAMCVIGETSTSAAGVVLPFLGFVERGTFHMTSYRICAASVVGSQLGLAFRDGLHLWFQAAHKAARDDRYLVGKTLKNFVT